ncbi:hypothetical protein Syun_031546 [Stephania yunnanensis]|uniref:Uncharacterized protein n=1 Tax=Stephania yunnanensis TaxID=152371 RepID=A0AAP0E3H4_9MAGN
MQVPVLAVTAVAIAVERSAGNDREWRGRRDKKERRGRDDFLRMTCGGSDYSTKQKTRNLLIRFGHLFLISRPKTLWIDCERDCWLEQNNATARSCCYSVAISVERSTDDGGEWRGSRDKKERRGRDDFLKMTCGFRLFYKTRNH